MNFRKNKDYIQIIENSGCEDENLMELIMDVNFHLDYQMDKSEFKVPIIKNGDITKLKISPEFEKFDNLDEVKSFIIEKSKYNYFFTYSFKNLELGYATLDVSKYKVNGLVEQRKRKLRNKKIEQILND